MSMRMSVRMSIHMSRSGEVIVFMASDSAQAKQQARARFGDSLLLACEGEAVHSGMHGDASGRDHSGGDRTTDGIFDVMADWWLLGEAGTFVWQCL